MPTLNPRKVLWFTTLLLAALSIFVLWGGAHATARSLTQEELDEFGVTLLGGTRSSLDRCIRRCERNNPPLPSPQPTHSPKPLPCEPFSSAVVRDFADGQERMLCFDVAGAGPAIVTVASQNHGNASCASAESTLTSPSGKTYYSHGTQVGGALMREPGRWYFWAHLFEASDLPGCHTYTFTVTK